LRHCLPMTSRVRNQISGSCSTHPGCG
jgi:hypothetical protein